ncbi:MAG TPA: pyrroloquinoline quinone biosynthesis protein PqqE, partial [Bryobacteraceae bacterium]
THRCPLHCVYCSNPVEMQKRSAELAAEDWAEIFRQAGEMGVLQLHLTGGEPLARADIAELVRAGRAAKLYINLITSGVGLDEAKLDGLIEAGLDHVQLSFQDTEEATANEYAGTRSHALKLRIAELIRSRRVAFTVNMVVHRRNIEHLPDMIGFVERSGAKRMEIANVQYYGWAFENREKLLPTREQLERSVAVVDAARERLKGKLRIDFVMPDYYAQYPKPCMNGWGHQQILIDPAGRVLPCHAAPIIPGLEFFRAPEHDLQWIWNESPVFNRFRDDSWMPDPCRGCDRRTRDFGGCRCQAFLLTGNAAATDPVCKFSPHRAVIDETLARVQTTTGGNGNWLYRIDPR